MANYKNPSKRASETVTFRLTPEERRLFEHVACLSSMGLTDLFRDLLEERARELGASPPERCARRRPGRPKGSGARPGPTGIEAVNPDVGSAVAPDRSESRASASTREASVEERTFGWIARRFMAHSAGRAEGTRADIREAVGFLTEDREGGPVIPADTLLSSIDGERLSGARERIRRVDLRFSRKNLYLTYLRMMLQWASRQPEIGIDFACEEFLGPLTAKEVADAWPSVVPPRPQQ